MFADPKSTLYTILTVAIGLLTIFLCVTLIYTILILRDASKMTEKMRSTIDRINQFVIKPISLASAVVDHVRPLIEAALERRMEEPQKKKRKR